jgi:hypothetical protein
MNETNASRAMTDAELHGVVGGMSLLNTAATKLLRPLPASRRASATAGMVPSFRGAVAAGGAAPAAAAPAAGRSCAGGVCPV